MIVLRPDADDLEHWRALIHLLVTPSRGRGGRCFGATTLGFLMTEV